MKINKLQLQILRTIKGEKRTIEVANEIDKNRSTASTNMTKLKVNGFLKTRYLHPAIYWRLSEKGLLYLKSKRSPNKIY